MYNIVLLCLFCRYQPRTYTELIINPVAPGETGAGCLTA